MDDPNADPVEIERSFRFIRRVNRWLGGASSLIAVLERAVPRWPSDRPFRWLDVATGAADIPLAVDAWARRRGVSIECVALDKLPACLSVARAAVGDHPRITVVEGDAFALAERFGPRSFDLAHAAMFLHHLTDDEIVAVLAEMRDVSSGAVVWNDLLRSGWSRLAIRVLTLAAPPFVREDAVLSVEKGFTPRSARDLAERAKLTSIEARCRYLLGRLVLTAEATSDRAPITRRSSGSSPSPSERSSRNP